MSAFMDICLRRQTCREFADRPVEHDKLAQCVEAARMAPSGCNAQPWSFVVAESPDAVKQVGEAIAINGANPYALQAKAFVVILEEHAQLMPAIAAMIDSQYFAKGDLGAAAAYLCLEAEAQGLATCQFGIFDRAKIAKALGFSEEKQFGAVIGIGYAANPAVRKKQRKAVDAITRYV